MRAFEILPAGDRETVIRWLAQLGLDPQHLDAVPPLRHLVEVLACTKIVSDLSPPLSREVAWQKAAAMLELKDPLRTWYRWQRNVCRMEEAEIARFCQDDEAPRQTLNVA